jgi:hypothetical protein
MSDDLQTIAVAIANDLHAGGQPPFACENCDLKSCLRCARAQKVFQVLEALKEHLQPNPLAADVLMPVADEPMSLVKQALELIADEYLRAADMHPPFHNAHEGYAVLLEEVRELEAEVFTKGEKRSPAVTPRIKEEAVHVGAMATRFLIDVCLRGEARK